MSKVITEFRRDVYRPNAFSTAPIVRKCYQYGGEIYRTPQAALKAAAWSMIQKKYGLFNAIDEVKRVLNMECDCLEKHPTGDYGQQEGFLWEICQLHSRDDGYFKRLHLRLYKALLSKYGYSENWRDNEKASGEL
jgi:hypothetical protein